jgi:hypothetical protein
VWTLIDRGEAHLLEVDGGMGVLQFVQTPQQKQIVIWLAAGTMDAMRKIETMTCDIGWLEGCDVAVVRGRPGWERTFLVREAGWQPAHVTYRKELR